jgi:hypothetical protein
MRIRVGRTILSLALCAGLSASAEAKLPVDSLSLALGFGVEASASPQREILSLWRGYLTEGSDSLRFKMWSASERLDGTHYDLVGPYVYQGFRHFTVVHLGPAVGLPRTFVIRTLVSAVEDSTENVRPLALYRVYATQEDGRWVLANALPRNTRDWHRTTIGKVTFVHPPTHAFNQRLGQASSVFVDSLARAFGLPELKPITYYFTDDLGEVLRALGLEYFPYGSDSLGGRSNIYARHVYVGSPFNGEGYVHELAHVVLAGEVARGTAHVLVEGLMTWTGGSSGQSYAELAPRLARYLVDHPDLSLESVLRNPPQRAGGLDVGYVGPAVLCAMVFERRGLVGVRTLLSDGRDPDAILRTAAQLLDVPLSRLNGLWRAATGAPQPPR